MDIPVTLKDVSLDEIQVLWEALYLETGTGGPMHVYTDDCNWADSNIEFCKDEAEFGEHDYSPEARRLSLELIKHLEPLTSGQRVDLYEYAWANWVL